LRIGGLDALLISRKKNRKMFELEFHQRPIDVPPCVTY
jgi:hypothetical protein